jgi:hypothetical protein
VEGRVHHSHWFGEVTSRSLRHQWPGVESKCRLTGGCDSYHDNVLVGPDQPNLTVPEVADEGLLSMPSMRCAQTMRDASMSAALMKSTALPQASGKTAPGSPGRIRGTAPSTNADRRCHYDPAGLYRAEISLNLFPTRTVAVVPTTTAFCGVVFATEMMAQLGIHSPARPALW